MAAPELLIEAEDLARRFPRCEALAGVSFAVARGDVAALVGPNGSGKTTTLRILACILAPTRGRVRVAGFDAAERSLDARRRLGYLPENPPFYPEMRVAEFLAFRGRLRGLRGPRLAERLRAVTEQCGLGEATRRSLAHLSRGFRQRTALADCLLHEPEVLLLDEPFAGLDPVQDEALRGVLQGLGGRCAILFTTHALAEAEQLGQRALVLNAGRLAAAGTPAGLAAQYGGGSFAEAFRRLAAPAAVPGGARPA